MEGPQPAGARRLRNATTVLPAYQRAGRHRSGEQQVDGEDAARERDEPEPHDRQRGDRSTRSRRRTRKNVTGAIPTVPEVSPSRSETGSTGPKPRAAKSPCGLDRVGPILPEEPISIFRTVSEESNGLTQVAVGLPRSKVQFDSRALTSAIIASVPRTRPRLAAPARACSRAPYLT